MTLPNWSPIGRHGSVYDLPRDEGGQAAAERRRREAGIRDHNQLTAAEAVEAIRAMQARTQGKRLPDSTPQIRADRDGR